MQSATIPVPLRPASLPGDVGVANRRRHEPNGLAGLLGRHRLSGS